MNEEFGRLSGLLDELLMAEFTSSYWLMSSSDYLYLLIGWHLALALALAQLSREVDDGFPNLF